MPSPLKTLRQSPGYMPEEILMPDWLAGYVIWDTVGDTMWLGSGSYFLRLGSPIGEFRGTSGSNTRLGIMASGNNKDAAWRFVRTLMTHIDSNGVYDGIPVFKDSFETAVDAEITDEVDPRFGIAHYNADDAERLREQVYSTEKLAIYDEQIFAVISSEAKAYFAGQKTAEEAAAQIQSRISLYLAEQG